MPSTQPRRAQAYGSERTPVPIISPHTTQVDCHHAERRMRESMCGGVATSRVTARSLMVISTPPRDIVSSSSEGVPTSLTVSIMPPQTILSGWGRRNFRGRRSRAESTRGVNMKSALRAERMRERTGGAAPSERYPWGLGWAPGIGCAPWRGPVRARTASFLYCTLSTRQMCTTVSQHARGADDPHLHPRTKSECTAHRTAVDVVRPCAAPVGPCRLTG